MESEENNNQVVKNIYFNKLRIYDPIEIRDPDFWINTPDLELILNNALKGMSLADLPLRTRSKVDFPHKLPPQRCR